VNVLEAEFGIADAQLRCASARRVEGGRRHDAELAVRDETLVQLERRADAQGIAADLRPFEERVEFVVPVDDGLINLTKMGHAGEAVAASTNLPDQPAGPTCRFSLNPDHDRLPRSVRGIRDAAARSLRGWGARRLGRSKIRKPRVIGPPAARSGIRRQYGPIKAVQGWGGNSRGNRFKLTVVEKHRRSVHS
jgi:hypothetical protein